MYEQPICKHFCRVKGTKFFLYVSLRRALQHWKETGKTPLHMLSILCFPECNGTTELFYAI